jgi:hypothetical protein
MIAPSHPPGTTDSVSGEVATDSVLDALATPSVAGSRAKCRFTDAEDRAIIEMFEAMGIREWAVISRRLGTRTPRQCRERWRHYLRPVIAAAPWTPEEDELLRHEFMRCGPRWAQISALFSVRTEVNLKNRWTTLTREQTRPSRKPPPHLRPQFPPISALMRSIAVGGESCPLTPDTNDHVLS